MKEYIKPVLELVNFATEVITSGPEFGDTDGSVGGDLD